MLTKTDFDFNNKVFLFQDACFICQRFISPDEKVSCSVRNCCAAYHLTCAKTKYRFSDPKKFSCPQHVSGCFSFVSLIQLLHPWYKNIRLYVYRYALYVIRSRLTGDASVAPWHHMTSVLLGLKQFYIYPINKGKLFVGGTHQIGGKMRLIYKFPFHKLSFN